MEENIMKIIRDGKEIKLTSEELRNAYYEQRDLFDIQDIEGNMEVYLTWEEHYTLQGNEDFIKDAANELRINQDKYDMDFESAIKEAFREAKLLYLN